tara:strand:- start:192 stop:737 length:546 start_codon:yes stop_codon:yes gene_type:complete
MGRRAMRQKYSGYTLIEMLATIAIIGIALPIIFNVLINSFNSLSKIEKLQLSELQHQQFRGRLNYDFDNIYRIYHLSSDSISFTAFRNNSFQDLIEYYLNTDTLFFKINRSSKTIVYNNFIGNQTRFEFKNYDNTPYVPGNGISFTAPEMNSVEKLIFSYSYRSQDRTQSGKILRIKKSNE